MAAAAEVMESVTTIVVVLIGVGVEVDPPGVIRKRRIEIICMSKMVLVIEFWRCPCAMSTILQEIEIYGAVALTFSWVYVKSK